MGAPDAIKIHRTLKMERLHYSSHSACNKDFLSRIPEAIIGHSNDPKHEDLQAGSRRTYQRSSKSFLCGLVINKDQQPNQQNNTGITLWEAACNHPFISATTFVQTFSNFPSSPQNMY